MIAVTESNIPVTKTIHFNKILALYVKKKRQLQHDARMPRLNIISYLKININIIFFTLYNQMFHQRFSKFSRIFADGIEYCTISARMVRFRLMFLYEIRFDIELCA